MIVLREKERKEEKNMSVVCSSYFTFRKKGKRTKKTYDIPM
jgi:hypothetical protein